MSSQRRERPVKPIPDALDAEETLALERRLVTPAALLGLVAGIFPILGFALRTIASNGVEDRIDKVVSVGQSLTRFGTGDKAGIAGRQAEIVSHYGDNWVLIAAAAVLTGIGTLVSIPLLFVLIRGGWRRRPSFPKWFVWAPVVGGIALGVVTVLVLVYQASQYHDFAQMAAGAQTNSAARDALRSATDDLGWARPVGSVGSLLSAVAIGAAGLSAMNAGLLTRVLGSIGVLIAVLAVLPIFGQQGVVLSGFWFVAVSLLVLGRWPGGRPEAWEDGESHPWPSRAQILEQADREQAGASRGSSSRSDAPAPTPKAQQGSKKRKRRK